MSDLKSQFEAALQAVKGLSERPDNELLLKLYALYKQATDGDAHGEKPKFWDVVGAAKFEAWEKLKGLDKDQAMQKYIDLVARLTG